MLSFVNPKEPCIISRAATPSLWKHVLTDRSFSPQVRNSDQRFLLEGKKARSAAYPRSGSTLFPRPRLGAPKSTVPPTAQFRWPEGITKSLSHEVPREELESGAVAGALREIEEEEGQSIVLGGLHLPIQSRLNDSLHQAPSPNPGLTPPGSNASPSRDSSNDYAAKLSSASVVLSSKGNISVSMACSGVQYPFNSTQPDWSYSIDSTFANVPLTSGYQQPESLHAVYLGPSQSHDQPLQQSWLTAQRQLASQTLHPQYVSPPAMTENSAPGSSWHSSPSTNMEQDMTSPVGTASTGIVEHSLSPQTPPTPPDAAPWHAISVAYQINTQETPQQLCSALKYEASATHVLSPMSVLPQFGAAPPVPVSTEIQLPLLYDTVLFGSDLQCLSEAADPWQPVKPRNKNLEVQVSVGHPQMHDHGRPSPPKRLSVIRRKDIHKATATATAATCAPRSTRRSRSLPQQKKSDSSQSGKAVKRKAFEEDRRQQTSRTRDIGACVRCRIQRVRCVAVTDDPHGPCRDCLRIAMSTSKKKIHHIECLRYKLQEIGLFRTCGLRFTTRWTGAEIRDITGFGPILTIKIDQGSQVGLEVQVRQFVPDANVDNQNVFENPYALASAHNTKTFYRSFIKKEKFNAYEHSMKRIPRDNDGVFIAKVYRMAGLHYLRLCKEDSTPGQNLYSSTLKVEDVSEKSYMEGIFELWFALRQATGTSSVQNGSPIAEHEASSIHEGKATPKMAVCQLNSINIACVLRPLAKILLRVMTTWISDRRHHRWLSIFFSTFILMHQIAETTADAYHHGRKNADGSLKKSSKLTIHNKRPNFAECLSTIQESANIIQAYWHYFNCNIDIETLDEVARSKSPLHTLSSDEFQQMRGIWKEGKERAVKRSFDNPWGHAWCHPLYFAAATFQSSWRPMPTFSG